MKIKSWLPQREIDICLRVREVRLAFSLSQADFAQSVGATREAIATYENCKVPVRFWLASCLSRSYGVNLRWLATGKLPKMREAELHADLEQQLDEDQLFSEIYDRCLSEAFERSFAELRATAEATRSKSEVPTLFFDMMPLARTRAESYLRWIKDYLEDTMRALPTAVVGKMLAHLYDESEKFKYSHKDEIEKERAFETSEPKSSESVSDIVLDKLDDGSKTVAEMKPLDDLVASLRELALQRGMQSRVAKQLGVTRQAVNYWISGVTRPADEIIPALSNVVRQLQGSKQNSSGTAATAPEPKTQNKKVPHEKKNKLNSGRKKF